jgi:hypothetical protein
MFVCMYVCMCACARARACVGVYVCIYEGRLLQLCWMCGPHSMYIHPPYIFINTRFLAQTSCYLFVTKCLPSTSVHLHSSSCLCCTFSARLLVLNQGVTQPCGERENCSRRYWKACCLLQRQLDQVSRLLQQVRVAP